MISVQNEGIKKKLEKRLINERPELLWSFSKADIKSLPNELIINKYLSSGSFQDWKDLKVAYDKSSIKEVWENEFLLGGFQLQKQKELVAFFFESKNPSKFISSNKRRKINRSIGRSF